MVISCKELLKQKESIIEDKCSDLLNKIHNSLLEHDSIRIDIGEIPKDVNCTNLKRYLIGKGYNACYDGILNSLFVEADYNE